jgi:hypothetical protein
MVSEERESPRALNPLWIISLFLGLAEATVGISTTQAYGWVQGMLAVFSVAFPAAIAAIFFLILWKKPYVLYAPKDYSDRPGIREFVGALSSSTNRSLDNVESAIRSAFETVIDPQLTDIGEARKESLVQEAVETAQRDVRRRTVEVDLGGIHSSLRTSPFIFPISDRTTVADLLDSVYFAISDFVSPFSYGDEWMLLDEKTGNTHREIGTSWAKKALDQSRDWRPLKDVGIDPGDRLIAVEVA